MLIITANSSPSYKNLGSHLHGKKTALRFCTCFTAKEEQERSVCDLTNKGGCDPAKWASRRAEKYQQYWKYIYIFIKVKWACDKGVTCQTWASRIDFFFFFFFPKTGHLVVGESLCVSKSWRYLQLNLSFAYVCRLMTFYWRRQQRNILSILLKQKKVITTARSLKSTTQGGAAGCPTTGCQDGLKLLILLRAHWNITSRLPKNRLFK